MFFKIKLAGVTVAINSLYDGVYRLCRNYLTDGDEDFTVTISKEDIDFEREKYAQKSQNERQPLIDHPDFYLETLAVYRKIAVKMLSYNTCLMHGSAVAVGNRAFLFTAPSGTGKTTHTDLWIKHIPGAYIVNGDKPLIRTEQSGCTVSGTPWAGKEGHNSNVTVPLCAVCILQRGEKNRIEPISFREAYPVLFEQIYKPYGRKDILKTIALIKNFSKTVRFYRLFCNMEPEAALVAYEGMQTQEL